MRDAEGEKIRLHPRHSTCCNQVNEIKRHWRTLKICFEKATLDSFFSSCRWASAPGSRGCLAGRSLNSWPRWWTDSASWPMTTPAAPSETESEKQQANWQFQWGRSELHVFCLFGPLVLARALLCPGWETASSSWRRELSGGRRSCSDSICTAWISQTRDQSRSWEEGQTRLWPPQEYYFYSFHMWIQRKWLHGAIISQYNDKTWELSTETTLFWTKQQ